MGKEGSKLVIPQNTIQVIQKHQFRFQKKFGQNFLVDSRVLDRIVEAAELTQEDCVLEIGPGIGTMTQYLSEAAGRVIAVEIDRNLIPILEETLQGYDNVTVLNQDILDMDISSLAQRYHEGKRLKVCANLPYYITTPIVMRLLESRAPVSSITVMVQKEVAMRMQAGPGTKDYGALSLAVQYYADASIITNVPPNCFIPRPGVGSAVISLRVLEKPRYEVKDEDMLFSLIRAAFNQRRKTLANAASGAGKGLFQREAIIQALEKMNLPENIRGEALTLEQFALLCDLLETHEQ